MYEFSNSLFSRVASAAVRKRREEGREEKREEGKSLCREGCNIENGPSGQHEEKRARERGGKGQNDRVRERAKGKRGLVTLEKKLECREILVVLLSMGI